MSRLLVIRAIDDEASLALAAGAILNRLIPKITHIILLAVPIIIISGSILFSLNFEKVSIDQSKLAIFPDIVSGFFAFIKSNVVWIWFPSIIFALLALLAIGRAVYGLEMAGTPLNCQINTQSAPDGTALSKLITLTSGRAERHLRHGIYEHVDCAETIADWVSAQL